MNEITKVSHKSSTRGNIEEGYCDIEPNEFMKKEFQKSIDKAGSVGLHLVHIFNIDPISKDLQCYAAYFDEFADAECYAYEYDEKYKENHNEDMGTYLIYINCKLYRGRFKGSYAENMMGLKKEKITEKEKK